jgi:hypothetical protein
MRRQRQTMWMREWRLSGAKEEEGGDLSTGIFGGGAAHVGGEYAESKPVCGRDYSRSL